MQATEAINKQTWQQKWDSYKRHPLSLILFLAVSLAMLITVGVLVLLIGYILIKGIPHLTPSLFSLTYTSDNVSLMPALVNTILMTLMSLLFAVPLAFQLGVSPILMGVMAILGAVGGTASPIALTGIIVGDLLSEMNVAMPGNAIFLGVTAANVMCALVVYLLFKGWKLRGESTQSQEAIAFDGIQKFSLLLIAILFVAVVGFSQDVGFVCFTLAFVLLMTGKVDEKAAVKRLPWNTLILICGISVLMNLVKLLGGIDLMAKGLAYFMNQYTAAAFMGMTGGIMSWFSSANGVVFPTLIPTVSKVAANVGGASLIQMVAAIVCSATVAGISPMSTGGSLIMAGVAQEERGKAEEAGLFAKLFGLSALCVVIVFAFTLAGGLKFLS